MTPRALACAILLAAVLPLGAQAKEHGPHLKLKNDFLLAEYLKKRVLDAADVVVAPTINYNYYPAFIHYPGSTSLSAETGRDVVVQIVNTLAAYGPRRFYIINTGVSTVIPLQQAQEQLAKDSLTMRFTNLGVVLRDVEKEVAKREGLPPQRRPAPRARLDDERHLLADGDLGRPHPGHPRQGAAYHGSARHRGSPGHRTAEPDVTRKCAARI